MSYAIIRNEKKKLKDLAGLFKHNQRRYKKHSNLDIIEEKTKENYFIKKCPTTYTTAFYNLIKKYNLLDTTKVIKKNRVVVCEMIITSDNAFFNNNGETEEKRYFQEAFNFIANYKGLTEEFILDAVIHKDEKEPHLHLVFMPVIHNIDSKSGKEQIKLNASEYWKGQDSYRKLQDAFYNHIKNAGFDLERGKENSQAKHYDLEEFKRITDYKVREIPENFKEREIPIKSNNKKAIQEDYLRVIQKCNSMSGTFKSLNNDFNQFILRQQKIQEKQEKTIAELQTELDSKTVENENLREKNFELNNFISRALLYVEEAFDISKDKFISLVENFKTKQEKLTEELQNIQKEIHKNFNALNLKNLKLKGKDKYDK